MNDIRKIVAKDDESLYAENLIKLANDTEHFGRMNNPTGSAYLKGPCGDKIIEEVKFYTEGCIATRICGSMTAQLVLGKIVDDVLGIFGQKGHKFIKQFAEK